MKEVLNICCVQSEIIWEHPKANADHYDTLFQSIPKGADLIVLPEMFMTGFSMNAEHCAESMDGASIQWMENKAKQYNCALMGSLIIREETNYFNRLLFVYPNGKIRYYDKRHLFTLAGEDKVYTSGKEILVLDYLGWNICPMICYDLRFPAWARNTKGYDVLLFVANWPKPRIDAWDTLLKARAIENMSYVIGVNRVGQDHNGLEYVGHSQGFDALGNRLNERNEPKQKIMTIRLNKTKLQETRNQFQFLNDRDFFTIAE